MPFTMLQAIIVGTQEAGVNNGGPSGPSLFQAILLYAAIIIALLLLTYWASRYLTKRVKGFAGGRYMRVLERIVVGKDQQIALLELGDKVLIVGVASQRITTLGELDKAQLTPLESSGGGEAGGFALVLKDALKKGLPFSLGKKPEGDQEP